MRKARTLWKMCLKAVSYQFHTGHVEPIGEPIVELIPVPIVELIPTLGIQVHVFLEPSSSSSLCQLRTFFTLVHQTLFSESHTCNCRTKAQYKALMKKKT